MSNFGGFGSVTLAELHGISQGPCSHRRTVDIPPRWTIAAAHIFKAMFARTHMAVRTCRRLLEAFDPLQDLHVIHTGLLGFDSLGLRTTSSGFSPVSASPVTCNPSNTKSLVLSVLFFRGDTFLVCCVSCLLWCFEVKILLLGQVGLFFPVSSSVSDVTHRAPLVTHP
jgi:hypothetical protein